MTLRGIDISNWQKGFSVTSAKPGFMICKATEGNSFVDPTCNMFVQQAKAAGIPWGFYHFARPGDAATQAEYFYKHTWNYVGKGIPVLDFEDTRLTNDWLNSFVLKYHELTNVFPWVYMNSDFVNNRRYGTDYVKKNCGLWLAGYPQKLTAYPAGSECPYKHDGWTLAAWQFTSSLSMGGMNIDGDFFYGDANAWNAYATGGVGSRQPDLSQYTDWQLARRVIEGRYGNGTTRAETLGDRYKSVQAKVNLLVSGTDAQLAKYVWSGEVGNGKDRQYVLGSRYAAVQNAVNKGIGK